MSRFILASIALALSCTCQAGTPATAPKKTLTAFASEAQLRDFFKTYGEQQRARQARSAGLSGLVQPSAMALSPPSAPAPAMAKSAAAGESVTNTQTAGVDEGGIVKAHGKHLVMLRRGRLFTVDIGQGGLRPVASIDAYAPGGDPSGSWYDEMLISGDTVVVIGYNYSRGGTEIGLFDIDNGGQLHYRATYHMRSNDYYSSRNYASRLIGSKLVLYTPLQINAWQVDPFASFPALRKWRPDATPADFRRIAPATRIYRTDQPLDPNAGIALHTVTVCDLAKAEMSCEASAVLGPQGRVFYVSGESVYVWITGRASSGRASQSGVFRMPLDGGAPSALKVAGVPVDQFSFLESGDGHLNVLLRSEGQGDGMWGAERGHGAMALLRVPLRLFSDGRDSAPAASYKALPPAGNQVLQNRYIGSYLLYGGPTGRDYPARQSLYAVRWGEAGAAQALSLPHGVERIEAMGENALVIGAGGQDLHFSSVSLGRVAALAHRYVRADAAQGETRSHGFFYHAGRAEDGIIGLPVLEAGPDGAGASVLYLRNSALQLTELGALQARPGAPADDGCHASCVDWYGNARPLFLQDRIFALLGYELVEGRLQDMRLVETRRINYAPR
ncbi:hypothetical protein AAKU55_004560 [Oxalobacteraceae bacterium GrIS 1.11]